MKNYSCPMCCNKGFPTLEGLKQHLLKAASAVTCPACYKSFTNFFYLIKHLDSCRLAEGGTEVQEEKYEKFDDNTTLESLESEEDDIDGYFCTVCAIKIPDVDKHIEQCHSGQEIILQDDDDDEEEKLSPSNNSQFYSTTSKGSKRKQCDMNREVENSGNDKNDEILYCPLCEVAFNSLAEHTSVYHKNSRIRVQDVSIHELFSATRQKKGSIVYYCTACRKTITRRKTLAKHLNMRSTKQERCKKNKSYSWSEENYSNAEVELVKVEDADFAELEDIEHTIFDS